MRGCCLARRPIKHRGLSGGGTNIEASFARLSTRECQTVTTSTIPLKAAKSDGLRV
jgi:hypothetical protein